jgi:hypothetical protein
MRIHCLGLDARGFCLPPFTLRAGEALCLHVPSIDPPWYDLLLPLITGQTAHPALQFTGTVTYLQKPVPRRRWWLLGRMRNPAAGDWLTADRRLSPAEATATLQRLSIVPRTPIGSLGWNERSLLAVEAFLLRPPDVLVFETTGQDPLGERRVLDRLSSAPADLALVYLKMLRDRPHPCLPRGTCLDVAARP